MKRKAKKRTAASDMTDYTSISVQEFCQRLEAPCPTLILLPLEPSADAVGSGFALRRVLEELGSESYCLCCDELSRRLSFLAEGLQESLLPESLPDEFLPERVISVGADSLAALGELGELYEGTVDLAIGAEAPEPPFSDFCFSQEAFATGELMFDVVKYLAECGRATVTEALCTCLYAAISDRTNGFRNEYTTPEAHIRAAELVASGIPCAEINHRLFNTRSMGQLRAMAAGISNLHLFAEGRVAVILFPYAIQAALGLEEEDLNGLPDAARALEGVQVSAVIRQPSTEAVFRVTVHSEGEFSASALCRRFNGSGNEQQATCTIHAVDGEEAMEKLVNSMDLSLFN